MKKTTKKRSASKSARKKAVKDLDVKPAKGGTVRGGEVDFFGNASGIKQSPNA